MLALRAAWSTNCSVVRALTNACSRACCSMLRLPGSYGVAARARQRADILQIIVADGGAVARRVRGVGRIFRRAAHQHLGGNGLVRVRPAATHGPPRTTRRVSA